MFNLVKKDFVFTKKMILIALAYSIILPIILLLDGEGKEFFSDLLIPLAFVTAPVSRIMNKEDTKSGLILQKTLPVSSAEIVGARFIFVIILMILSEIILTVMKFAVYKTGGLGETAVGVLPVMIGFMTYYSVYLAIYYWKGYYATQFCVYALIIIVVIGSKAIARMNIDIATTLNNKSWVYAGVLLILGLSFIASCFFENRKKLDS